MICRTYDIRGCFFGDQYKWASEIKKKLKILCGPKGIRLVFKTEEEMEGEEEEEWREKEEEWGNAMLGTPRTEV